MCIPEAVAKEFEVTASLGVNACLALVMSRLPWSAIVNGTSACRQFGSLMQTTGDYGNLLVPGAITRRLLVPLGNQFHLATASQLPATTRQLARERWLVVNWSLGLCDRCLKQMF